MDRSDVRRVLRGEFTPGTLRTFLAIVLTAIVLFLGAAWAIDDLYNPGRSYNILVNQISDLGNPNHNPGFYLFSLALWMLSFAAIPLLQFFRRTLALLQAKVAGVFTFFFALCIPGTVLVGFCPSSLNQTVHLIAAAFAFGGIGLAFFLSGFGIIKSKVRDHNDKISLALAIPFVPFIGFVIVGFAVVGYTAALGIFNDVGGKWLSFSLWEWLLLGAILAMCAATSLPLARLEQTTVK
jgi:hypothetical protein